MTRTFLAILCSTASVGCLPPSREDVEAMRQQLEVAQDPEARLALRRRILIGINTNALMPEDPRFLVP